MKSDESIAWLGKGLGPLHGLRHDLGHWTQPLQLRTTLRVTRNWPGPGSGMPGDACCHHMSAREACTGSPQLPISAVQPVVEQTSQERGAPLNWVGNLVGIHSRWELRKCHLGHTAEATGARRTGPQSPGGDSTDSPMSAAATGTQLWPKLCR